MDKETYDKKIADMIAHRTPEDMARELIYTLEQRDQLQRDNDSYLFSKERADREVPQNAPTNEARAQGIEGALDNTPDDDEPGGEDDDLEDADDDTVDERDDQVP